jgi:hypothetical protein
LFGIIPTMCERWRLNKLHSPELDSLYTLFGGMAVMRIPWHDPTNMVVTASRHNSSIPVGEIYGTMAASGVQIAPLPDDTIEEA